MSVIGLQGANIFGSSADRNRADASTSGRQLPFSAAHRMVGALAQLACKTQRSCCSRGDLRVRGVAALQQAGAPFDDPPDLNFEVAPDSGDWDTVWVEQAAELQQQEWLDEDAVEDTTGKPRSGKRLPAEVRCFDTARIFVKGGDGGKGCVAFRREKFVPKGGPSGGNGGQGGNVWALADDSLNSLTTFRKQVHYRAEPGSPGGGSNMAGASGGDMLVRVPPGTIIRARDAAEDDAPLAELIQPGSRALLACGGRGGRGNASFKTGRNTAPAMAEFGEKGGGSWLDLELKLVADIGIVGAPNAGKSTLLSVVSAARPKVADYPFTTLVPNLGVCEMDFRSTVFADIPGLLEGAHLGVGLGHQFLRHIQRCRALVHVLDGTSPDPIGDYRAIRLELEMFSPELVAKPQVVAYNKMDLPDSSDYWDEVQEFLLAQGVAPENIHAISAVTGSGVVEVVRRVRSLLDGMPDDWATPETAAVNVTAAPKKYDGARIDQFTIEEDLAGPRIWVVQGEGIERFAQMTNWDYFESALRFQKVLEASGAGRALRKRGVQEGDTVVIGDLELLWSEDRSEGNLYDAWVADRRLRGRVAQGSARWPHAGG